MLLKDKLAALSLALPPSPKPVAPCVPHRFDVGLLYLPGQGLCKPDGSYSVDRLGKGIVIDHAYAYARFTGLHLLELALGNLVLISKTSSGSWGWSTPSLISSTIPKSSAAV